MNLSKILWLPIIIVLSCGFLTGKEAGLDLWTLEDKAEDAEIEIPEREILLVERRFNRAWGHQDCGYFIDTQGCVYSFDFSSSPICVLEDGRTATFPEHLQEIMRTTEEEPIFDEEFVRQISLLGANLSAEDEFAEKHARCDYGQDTLYFYRAETQELLKCKSIGDIDYTPKNPSAAKIAELLEDYINNLRRQPPELE